MNDVATMGRPKGPSCRIHWGDVQPLGFRPSDVFEPSSKKATGFYWRKKGNRVFFTTCEGEGGVFRLSAADSMAFDANLLSLVPPGCCNASGRPTREFSHGRDSFPIDKADFLRDAR